MPSRCIVGGCKTGYRSVVSLHRFPHEPKRRKAWINFVNSTRKDFSPEDLTKSTFVCCMHFEDDCFLPGFYPVSDVVRGYRKRIKLKDTAVPTIKTISMEKRRKYHLIRLEKKLLSSCESKTFEEELNFLDENKRNLEEEAELYSIAQLIHSPEKKDSCEGIDDDEEDFFRNNIGQQLTETELSTPISQIGEMMECCVVACNNNISEPGFLNPEDWFALSDKKRESGEYFTFYLFPSCTSHEEELRRWAVIINRLENYSLWMPATDSRICSKHFKDHWPSVENPYPTEKLGYDFKGIPSSWRITSPCRSHLEENHENEKYSLRARKGSLETMKNKSTAKCHIISNRLCI